MKRVTTHRRCKKELPSRDQYLLLEAKNDKSSISKDEAVTLKMERERERKRVKRLHIASSSSAHGIASSLSFQLAQKDAENAALKSTVSDLQKHQQRTISHGIAVVFQEELGTETVRVIEKTGKFKCELFHDNQHEFTKPPAPNRIRTIDIRQYFCGFDEATLTALQANDRFPTVNKKFHGKSWTGALQPGNKRYHMQFDQIEIQKLIHHFPQFIQDFYKGLVLAFPQYLVMMGVICTLVGCLDQAPHFDVKSLLLALYGKNKKDTRMMITAPFYIFMPFVETPFGVIKDNEETDELIRKFGSQYATAVADKSSSLPNMSFANAATCSPALLKQHHVETIMMQPGFAYAQGGAHLHFGKGSVDGATADNYRLYFPMYSNDIPFDASGSQLFVLHGDKQTQIPE